MSLVLCGTGAQEVDKAERFYTWMECQNRKNSNMVVFELKHCLDTMYQESGHARALRLFSVWPE